MTIRNLLPEEGKKFYDASYLKLLVSTEDPVLAEEGATALVKARLVEREGVLVANSESFAPVKVFQFSLEPREGEVIIKNSEDGIELDAVLATTEGRRTDGARFTVESLEELAAQINSEGSTFPDVDHQTLTKLEEQYAFDMDGLMAAIKREKGVFRSIKAAVKEGKLWIKAFLDKRYKNYSDKFKNLSIEAAALKTADNRLVKPKYIGFTFTNNPQLPGAGIAL